MSITKPGVYFDLDEAEYHGDPTPRGSLSSTWARKLMEPAGPARFHHERQNPQPFRKVFEFGHAAHALVLGVGAPIVEIPEKLLAKNGALSTDAAKAWVAEAREQGQTPLKPAEYAQVHAMAAKLREHPAAMALLTAQGTRREVSAFHIDPDTGMWLRARFDSIAPSGIVDYKTIVDADPRKFGRKTAAELGYYQQHAWYVDMAEAVELTDGPLRFILQEKSAPYLVSVAQLTELYVSLGRTRNRDAIRLYADCLATDTWPGFTGIAEVHPPQYLINQTDDELSDGIAAELAAYADQLAKEPA